MSSTCLAGSCTVCLFNPHCSNGCNAWTSVSHFPLGFLLPFAEEQNLWGSDGQVCYRPDALSLSQSTVSKHGHQPGKITHPPDCWGMQHCSFYSTCLWPPYEIGQAIIFLPCGFFLLSIFRPFFRAYCQRPQIGCLPYFHTWCGPSANLECRSEMCSMRLAGNTGRKKSPFWRYHTTLSGYIFGTKAYIDNREKTC